MNNVEKIKQEAQNLRDKLNDRVDENEFIAGEVFILNYFLSYIDLHNEPVSEEFEKNRTDAFIEKAISWLKEQDEMIGVSFQEDFLERFQDYMKGE